MTAAAVLEQLYLNGHLTDAYMLSNVAKDLKEYHLNLVKVHKTEKYRRRIFKEKIQETAEVNLKNLLRYYTLWTPSEIQRCRWTFGREVLIDTETALEYLSRPSLMVRDVGLVNNRLITHPDTWDLPRVEREYFCLYESSGMRMKFQLLCSLLGGLLSAAFPTHYFAANPLDFTWLVEQGVVSLYRIEFLLERHPEMFDTLELHRKALKKLRGYPTPCMTRMLLEHAYSAFQVRAKDVFGFYYHGRLLEDWLTLTWKEDPERLIQVLSKVKCSSQGGRKLLKRSKGSLPWQIVRAIVNRVFPTKARVVQSGIPSSFQPFWEGDSYALERFASVTSRLTIRHWKNGKRYLGYYAEYLVGDPVKYREAIGYLTASLDRKNIYALRFLLTVGRENEELMQAYYDRALELGSSLRAIKRINHWLHLDV